RRRRGTATTVTSANTREIKAKCWSCTSGLWPGPPEGKPPGPPPGNSPGYTPGKPPGIGTNATIKISAMIATSTAKVGSHWDRSLEDTAGLLIKPFSLLLHRGVVKKVPSTLSP